MNNISGIEFQKNAFGIPKSITIDLEIYGKDLESFLEKIGVNEFEDEFEKKWREGISGDEMIAKVLTHIRSLPWKKQ